MTDHRLSDDPIDHFLLSQGIIPTDASRRAAEQALAHPDDFGIVDEAGGQRVMAELSDSDRLMMTIAAEITAGLKRHETVAMFGGLDPSPARDRIEALYDQYIAEGLSDDEAMDRLIALLRSENPGPMGILAATEEDPA